MARIETSLHRDYCPRWGSWEGMREILQNALDAQDDGFPMEVKYFPGTERVLVVNRGVVLDRSSMLMGYTTKRDRNKRGQHGEGYKVGLLALLRSGAKVVVRSGYETWKAGVHESKNYGGQEVFCFDTRTRDNFTDAVEVEVFGIDEENWRICQLQVVPLMRKLFEAEGKDPGEVRSVSGASMFKHPELRGMLFVKDLFVCTLKGGFRYGYNLLDVVLDRDRLVPKAFDVEWETSSLVREVVRQGKDDEVVAACFEMLEAEAPEFRSGYGTSDLGSLAASRFREKHGENAHPVSSVAEAQNIEHVGKKGVVVSATLKAALVAEYEHPDAILERHAKEFKLVQLHDLTDDERTALTRALSRIDMVLPGTSDRTVVGEFNDPDIKGMWVERGSEIRLARSVLTDEWSALKVLVHEASHDGGGDGEHGHIRTEEEVWCQLVRVAAEGPAFLKFSN